MADRKSTAAFQVLRPSSKRLLLFVENEIVRQGGGRVVIFYDQLQVVGSVRIIITGLSELHALGLIDVQRHPKRFICGLSDRWRNVASLKEASIISGVARGQPVPKRLRAMPRLDNATP